MSAHPRLLDHPFYQAWNRGELSTETLSAYHRSYGEFIKRFPSYWQRVVDTFQQDLPRGASIVNEESEHIHLWELWGEGLSPVRLAIDAETARMLATLAPYGPPGIGRFAVQGMSRDVEGGLATIQGTLDPASMRKPDGRGGPARSRGGDGIGSVLRADWWRPLKSGEFWEFYRKNYKFLDRGDSGVKSS